VKAVVRFLFVIFISTSAVFAQVSIGTPAFSSIGGGPSDAINLGNLNAHLVIPVLHKAGRGVPFIYDLVYDSSIWTPVVSGGVKQWQPNSNWGWSTDAAPLVGYVTVSETTSTSGSGSCTMTTYTYSNYVYHDKLGATHPFSGTSYERFQPCSHPPFLTSNLVSTATDGSGYSISAFETTYTVTSPSGATLTGPANGQNGAGSYTDVNGNQITVNSSGQFFDTLSATTPVLTVAGSGTPSSPITLTYTAPSGATPEVSVQYTQYTVATNFGFTSGTVIHDYGPTSVALVSAIQLPDGTQYTFSYEATGGSCTPLGGTSSCVTGRVTGVTLPAGGSISYSYQGGPNSTGIFSDGSTAGFTRTLSPGGTWTYSRTNNSGTPGPGSLWTTTVEDASSPANYTVINFAEDSAVNGTSTVATYNMYETQRLSYQGSTSGTLLVTNTRCFNGSYASCATANVTSPITQTDAYTQLPGGQTRLSEVLYNGSFSGSGLVSKDEEFDYGVTTGSAPGTTHLILETDITYASLTNGIINLPSLVKVYDWSSGSSSLLSSTGYGYDETSVTSTSGTPQQVAITGSRGNLTTATVKTNSGGSTLSRTYTYYDTGNPYTVTDFNGATTTFNYASGSASCYNSFATSVSEPLSLSRSMSWNCTGGVATGASDENSQTVSTSYTDADFWRPYSTTDQLSNVTTISYSGQTAVESALSFNSSNSIVDLRTTVDGFGRPILTQRLQSPSATNYDTTQTDYNIVGQPSRSTMPFSASAGGTSSSAPGVATQYDALSRPTSVQDANGGTTSYTYSNNDVLVTVSGGTGTQAFKKQLEYDGLGRLSSVCEMSTTLTGVGTCSQTTSQTGYWTKYTYDALGHLLTVTQNAQASSGSRQSRTYTYDLLARVTSESNPETGSTTYTYDSVSPCADGNNYSYPGNLVERTDNAGNSTCYAYDSLNRLVQAGNTAVSNTILKKFVYDSESTYPTGVSVSNGKTRLVEAQTINTSSLSTPVTDEFFSYSARGELTDFYESTPHSSGFYHTSAAYWASGALQTLSGIPSVPTLYYGASGGAGLDGEGRYTEVTAGSGTNPMSAATYSTSSTTNFLGALTGVTYGSSDTDSFTYDPNTGRGSTYGFSVNGNSDSGTLTWNANGTLDSLSISDAISGTSDSQTCSYTYDDLGRVGGQDANGYSVDCGTNWQQLFTYDAFGNIVKSGSSSFAATYSVSTNQFSLGGGGVSYDSNGNLLTDNLNTYTWDPNWGNVTSVNGIAATYDALGRVVEQGSGSGYAQILYSPLGKVALMNGTSLTTAFVSLPGDGTAVYNSSGLAYYRHADWLGSSRLGSTQARGLYSSTAYAPFGEQYGTTGTADPSFIGQNSDTVSSLYDFTFRRLSPSQGRWISPDPAGLVAVDPTSPQTWNRYAYVANNPLSFTDPTGLYLWDPSMCGSNSYACGGGYNGPGGGGDSGPGGDEEPYYSWVPAVAAYYVGIDQDGNPEYSTTTGYWAVAGFYGAADSYGSESVDSVGSTSAPSNGPQNKKPGRVANYLGFLACEFNSTVEQLTDEEDAQTPVAVTVATAAAVGKQFAPWVRVTGAITLSSFMIKTAVTANQECTPLFY
jgi:RHS repeat-associated protein